MNSRNPDTWNYYYADAANIVEAPQSMGGMSLQTHEEWARANYWLQNPPPPRLSHWQQRRLAKRGRLI